MWKDKEEGKHKPHKAKINERISIMLHLCNLQIIAKKNLHLALSKAMADAFQKKIWEKY